MVTRTVVNTTIAVLFTASAMISFSASANDKDIVDRVKPVGHLVVLADSDSAKASDAASTESEAKSATATADAGKSTYDTACFACHGTGAAGAPITGNKDAWASRVGQGVDTLYSHAINGFNAMPPKGGAMNLTDEQVKAVVDYMVGQSS
jgi:cytochrome c5